LLPMPPYEKYKPSRKVLPPGAETGHLDDDQAKTIAENARQRDVTWQGYDRFWGPFEPGRYGVAIWDQTLSAGIRIALKITSYVTNKPPR
jgi:hypothetical protein